MLKTQIAGLFGLVLGITACTSTGEIADPFERRATWFSFISGEDIARTCQDDGFDQYRFVYVADRSIQVRIYDLRLYTDRQPELRSRVVPALFSDWLKVQNNGWADSTTSPTDAIEVIPLEAALPILTELNKAGWSTLPPPVGQKIASHSYFWLASGCEGGQFYFQAWDYPDKSFLDLAFPELLFALDTTELRPKTHPTDGVRRIHNGLSPRKGFSRKEDERELYNMTVTETGIIISQ